MDLGHPVALLSRWFRSAHCRAWMTRAAWLLLVINCMALVAYLFWGYQTIFHTDAATKNLLAQEIHETGQFFPPDWNYANRDLMVVFGQLLIIPFIGFVKNDFVLHAISGLGFSIAILWVLWKLTGLLTAERWQRLAAVAVVAGGLSFTTAENLFGQVAYGSVLLLAGVTMLFAWRALQSRGRGLVLAGAMLLVVITLATWSNPQRALISYTLPLLVAVGVFVFLGAGAGHFKDRVRPACTVVMVTFVGTVIGAMLSAWVLERVQNNNGVAAARWLSYDGALSNLVDSVQGIMGMFGGLPAAGGDVVSVSGVYQAVRLVSAVALVVLVPITVYRRMYEQADSVRFVAVFTATQAAACMFLFVATSIPDMTDPVTASRYLAPAVVLGLVLFLTASFTGARPWSSLLAGVTLLVLVTGNLVWFNREALPLSNKNAVHSHVVEALRENGLRYGYASYWNSGVYTVLSGHDSRIRQVLIIDGLPLPMRHLGSNLWYEPDAWKGETFLLLSKDEAGRVNWDAMRARTGAVPREVRVAQFTAYVYPMNIAARLPGWSREFNHPVTYRAVEGAMYNQGSWDDAKKAVVSRKGEAGFIAFGPYIHLPKGRYRADFMLSVNGVEPGADVATVDVVSGSASLQHAIRQIKAAPDNRYSIEFVLDRQADTVEIRTSSNGEAELEYKGVTLTPLSVPKVQ